MLSENTVKKILEHGLKQGADFTEVFVEDTVSSSINLLDQKIDEINSSNSFGIGIRLLYGNEAYEQDGTAVQESLMPDGMRVRHLMLMRDMSSTSWD